MSKEPKRNVYVGHRYVPKIMGEWDKTISYEGLSIVLNEGHSYTSKGYVPVGIDIKDEKYWALTGNYNAQVEHYRQTVVLFEDRITGNTELSESVQSDFNVLRSETDNKIVDFENNFNNRIENFETDMDNKNERQVSVIEFGAVGDGETDDTNAFKHAYNFCIENGYTLHSPDNRKYLIKGNLSLLGLKKLNLQGEIIGDDLNDIFEIGFNSSTHLNTSYNINHVAGLTLRISGLKNSQVTIQHADNLELYADRTDALRSSIAYNNFYLGMIRAMKITSPNNGWINENRFFGGRIKDLIMEGEYSHNHNHFYNPNFEGSTIDILSGTFNYFHNFRGEFGITVNLSDVTHSNVFIRSWNSSSTQFLRGRGKVIEWYDEGRENHNIGFPDMFYNKENFFTLSPNSNNIDYDIFDKRTRSSDREWLRREGNPDTVIFESRVTALKQAIRIRLYSDYRCFKFRLYAYDENQELIKEQNSRFTSIISGSFNSEEGYYYRLGADLDISLALVPNTGVAYFKIVILTDSIESSIFHYIKGDVYSPSYDVTPLIEGLPQYSYNRATKPPETYDGAYYAGEVIMSKNVNETGCIGWANKIDSNGGRWVEFGNLKSKGDYIADGNAIRVQWTIPHGLGVEPSKYGAVAMNRTTGLSNIIYITPNNSNLLVFTETAIPEGTENVQIHWWAEV